MGCLSKWRNRTALSGHSRPKGDAAPEEPGRARLQPTRFMLVFAFCLLLGFGLLFTPPVQKADEQFSGALVLISHALIIGCGGHALAQGTDLRSPAGGFAIEMKDGCNGVNVIILLCSAMLAFPASWKMKAVGFLAGGLIIQTLNVVRFISLYYIGQYSLFWFDLAHGYFWESLLMLDTMVIFWFWASRVSRPAHATHVTP